MEAVTESVMTINIAEIEGIGPKLCIKLEKAGIRTVDSLVGFCSSQKGRKEVSLKTGISEEKLLKWVNMIDLFRIEGLGIEFSELLEASGVEAIGELGKMDPEKLHDKMLKVNSTKKFVLQVPSLQEVQQFVSFAKSMRPIVLN